MMYIGKRWYTTGNEVTPTQNEISTAPGPTRILAVSSFTPSYAGTYSCEVRNNNNLQVTTTYPVILATYIQVSIILIWGQLN